MNKPLPQIACPQCHYLFTPKAKPAVLRRLASHLMIKFRRAPGGPSKVMVPCGWCRRSYGTSELKAHWRSCPDKPAGRPRVPCGWCGVELPQLEARAHIADCPKTPPEIVELRAQPGYAGGKRFRALDSTPERSQAQTGQPTIKQT